MSLPLLVWYSVVIYMPRPLCVVPRLVTVQYKRQLQTEFRRYSKTESGAAEVLCSGVEWYLEHVYFATRRDEWTGHKRRPFFECYNISSLSPPSPQRNISFFLTLTTSFSQAYSLNHVHPQVTIPVYCGSLGCHCRRLPRLAQARRPSSFHLCQRTLQCIQSRTPNSLVSVCRGMLNALLNRPLSMRKLTFQCHPLSFFPVFPAVVPLFKAVRIPLTLVSR
jgi:hypothetical protein